MRNGVLCRRASSSACSPTRFGRSFTLPRHVADRWPGEAAGAAAPAGRRARRRLRRRRRGQRGRRRRRQRPALRTTLEKRAQRARSSCKADTDGDGVDGRLRVPVGARPQRRRVPGAADASCPAPGEAAVPEPAVRATRSVDYDGDSLHARARSTRSGRPYRQPGAPDARRPRATPTASSTPPTAATAPAAASPAAWSRPDPTPSTPTSSAGPSAAGYATVWLSVATASAVTSSCRRTTRLRDLNQ